MIAASPIGVFDAGVGGLSVAAAIRAELPTERILHLADSAYRPYGGRPPEEIRERTLRIRHFLIERGAKAGVVACNSASGAAPEALRAEAVVPVIGMESAVKPAGATTRVGIMVAAATLQAERFDRLMREHARKVQVFSQACPGLVELVERGVVSGDEARRALEPLLAGAEVDSVVLGCTHYPFLTATIRELLGERLALIDTGAAVARPARRVLQSNGALLPGGEGGIRVFTTGAADVVSPVVARLWGRQLPVERVEV